MSSRYIGGIVTKNPTALNPALGNSANGIFTLDQYVQQKSAGTWPAFDPYYDFVTLNLHGNGTNGAQNNTFLDSSTNNFTITRNGNTTQGTFTPYGLNWSNYFDGSSAVVNRSNNTALAMGTGDFTIEFWMNAPSTSSVIVLYDSRLTTSSSTGGINIYHQSGTLYLYGGATTNVLLVSASITYNQWNHIAFVKSGSGTGNVKMYVNGALASTYGSADTSNYSLGYLAIGAFYNPSLASFYTGYLSNFRIVKGTAVYTSAFTPSATPLTAITNTSLLTCADNRFIDDSTNAFALTTSGSPSVQRFSPFNPASAYSTSVIGGSGYFDGSGDSLKVAYGSQMNLTNQDFAIELWVYLPAQLSNRSMLCQDQSNYQLNFYVDSGGNLTFYSYQSNGTENFNVPMGATPVGAWSHLVIARTGSTVAGFRNGTRIATATFAGTIDAQTGGWYVGAVYSNLNQMNGYLSDVRFVIGSNPYGVGTTLTVPTAPLTAITNTQFLGSFTNAAILDNAMMNNLETVGNAQISTSVKKYGTGSMAFDGTDDRLTAASSPNMAFGTGDFTVEAWIYTNTLSGERGFIQTSDTAGGLKTSYTTGIVILIDVSPYRLVANVGGTNVNSGSTYISATTWTHVAITRASGSVRLFINGTLVGGPTTITTNLTGQNIVIGGYYSTSYLWNGYVDDLRITKGYARYTANFTAPTSQLQDQ